MKEEEKAVPAAATVMDGNGQMFFGDVKPITNNTTTGSRLEDVLLHGHTNGISAAELTKLLGLPDTRALRDMVQHERENGCLVLSGQTGYYLPSDDVAMARAERKACAERLKSMGISLLRSARVIGRCE